MGHILVVDDEPAIRGMTMRALRQAGFVCDSAADGLEASSLISSVRFDAVVSDLRMPKRNGHTLAVELLELPDPPLVVIHTGVIEPALAKDLLNRNIDDILFKPIDPTVLAAKIANLIRRRKMLLERDL